SKTREKVTLVRKSGTGDMNYYGSHTGIPCVTYGPGNPHLDHTDEEHILIDDYLNSIEIVKQALLNLGKIHP
ncbi:MAG: M20/M25/M40 family metallo-hydrolase, partial [Candidatus Bathyarchaeota archaeon]